MEDMAPLHPETAIALGYAPAGVRPALAALFALDERLGGFVNRASEPVIGLMRLAWWRDALAGLDHGPPPAEPLLQTLAAICGKYAISGQELAGMAEGWEALLDEEPDGIERHARERGARLFALAARLLGGAGAMIEPAGRGWALADAARRSGDFAQARAALAAAREPLEQAMAARWPRRLRPLGMLAALAREDARGSAEALAPPGSRRRLLRILRHQLTGR
ncbi:MAG TPA: squalene/phytoene synthase family protein [Sphingomonas sp.]|nr:squalene/phytoene synthase family protein [Sphingomonas sp.]